MKIQAFTTVPGLFLLFLFAGCDGDGRETAGRETGETGARVVDNSIHVMSGDEGTIPVAVEWNEDMPACLESNGSLIPVQAEQLENGRTLLWMLAETSPVEERVYDPVSEGICTGGSWRWETAGGNRMQLLSDGIPVIEYVYPVYNSDNVEETKKPYHHVFSPDGARHITKGVGGRYSHHRGIFFGYNRVRFNDRELDIWHAEDGERPEHASINHEWTGPVFGGQEVIILWKDRVGDPFAEEVRRLRVFRRSDSATMIDIRTVLTSLAGTVELDGDLQHAGVQFRAAQYVSDNMEQSQFLRPEGWEEYPVDEEMGDPEQYTDLPWNAFRFFVDGEPYTVGYFSHPDNPQGAEMSERLYGRFGEFVPAVIDEENPLVLRYRLYITGGHETDREEMEREYAIYRATP
ncbi:MAG: DUF6807 family protein [Balneolaceae bacterium]